jgi:flagellin-like protein
MFCRRGLSSLVTTVLVVLVALVAVAIVWGFVKPIFDDSGLRVHMNTLCLDSEVVSMKCEYEIQDTSFNMKNVIVKHAKGDGVREVKAILTFDDGTMEMKSAVAPGLLGTYNFDDDFSVVSKRPVSLEVVAVIGNDSTSGELFTCSQVSKIECVGVGEGSWSGGTECSDGLDNDGDYAIDLADSGCSDLEDNVEANCGDSTKNDAEQCDGSDFNGQSCVLMGFVLDGTLGCDNDCNFDVSGCYECPAVCSGYTPYGSTYCTSNVCGLSGSCFWYDNSCSSCSVACNTFNNNQNGCSAINSQCGNMCRWCSDNTCISSSASCGSSGTPGPGEEDPSNPF